MRRLVLALFLVIGFIFCGNVYADLNDGLVAYYPFNGNANDESGDGNHGTANGASLTSDRFENADSAYSFDGDDYISLPINMEENFTVGNPIAFSLWFKSDGVIPSSTNETNAVILGADPGNGPDFAAVIDNGSSVSDLYGKLKVRLYGGDVDYGGNIAISDKSFIDDSWHHLVWGVGASGGFYYIDGVLQNETPNSGIYNRENSLMIGARVKFPHNFFRGKVDDIRIYNRALSECEILELYGTSLDDGLVAYYPFNGNANDESGNGNNGIVSGAIPTMDRYSVPDGAYYFDGDNDFIEVLNHESLNFGSNNFSFSLWVQIDSNINIQGGEALVLHKASGEIGGYFLAIRDYVEGHGRPFGNIGTDSGRYWGTDQDLRDNQWHFFTLVRNGDIGKLYIDGSLDVTVSGLANQPASIDRSLFIGEPGSSYGGNGEFKGKIDDVRIYNRALSECEILELYCDGDDLECTVVGDLTGDNVIDVNDYYAFRTTLGKCSGDTGFIQEADYDGDGCITYADYRIWYGYYMATL